MKNKKGQIQTAIYSLIFLAIGLVVVGTIVAFNGNFMTDTQADLVEDNLGASCGRNSSGGTAGTILYTACGVAYNTTFESLTAISDVAEGQGTVTTVGILTIVIGLLLGIVALFAGLGRGRE